MNPLPHFSSLDPPLLKCWMKLHPDDFSFLHPHFLHAPAGEPSGLTSGRSNLHSSGLVLKKRETNKKGRRKKKERKKKEKREKEKKKGKEEEKKRKEKKKEKKKERVFRLLF